MVYTEIKKIEKNYLAMGERNGQGGVGAETERDDSYFRYQDEGSRR
ncbi:MAG TPA: hypothetical protein IGQ44_00685 [Geminocystis sp. M7585_C2015_104]|nr:hypothetical protein [Geminocystis sp. M7585_C2015_104]